MHSSDGRRVSVSVACLGGDRVGVGIEMAARGLVNELHLDYFPDAPRGAHSLAADEVRRAYDSWVDATIHLWGTADSIDDLQLEPRVGLRTVIEQTAPSDVDSVSRMRSRGWDVGWSIPAAHWQTTLARLTAVQTMPGHVQVVSTDTPGFVGGRFLGITRDAVHWFAENGASVSVDGGLTAAVVAEIGNAETVVLGTNALGQAVSSIAALEDLMLSARASWLRAYVSETGGP